MINDLFMIGITLLIMFVYFGLKEEIKESKKTVNELNYKFEALYDDEGLIKARNNQCGINRIEETLSVRLVALEEENKLLKETEKEIRKEHNDNWFE